MRQNINVGIGYIESWLRGIGCVPLYNLMEDAATAEISRAQVWQWIRHGAKLDDGRHVDLPLCRAILDEELAKLRKAAGEEAWKAGRYGDAGEALPRPHRGAGLRRIPDAAGLRHGGWRRLKPQLALSSTMGVDNTGRVGAAAGGGRSPSLWQGSNGSAFSPKNTSRNVGSC